MPVPGLQPHLVLGVRLQGEEHVAGRLPVVPGVEAEGRGGGQGGLEVDVGQDDVVPPAPGVVHCTVVLPENHLKFVCKNNILRTNWQKE